LVLIAVLGTAGMYCDRSGLPAPYGNCSLGYYCPAGQVSPTPADKECQPGHFCPEASTAHYVCAAGTYQPNSGKGNCFDCEPGYYCDPNEAIANQSSGVNSSSHGVVNPTICPAGYYCPQNTITYVQFPCQQGYFGNRSKLQSHDDCFPCTPGYYCDRQAMTHPENKCHVGYYCSEKALTPKPENITEGGGPCLPGFYCESGYSRPLPCPKGTFGSRMYLGHLNECTDCDGGKFCPEDGLSSPNGSCYAGYYCKGRAVLPNPVDESYGDECPPGYYCPESTTTPFACPPGTFNNQTKGKRPQDCQPCTGGSYCGGYANKLPDDYCAAGYYCTRGAYTPRPTEYENLSHNSSDLYSCPIYSVNQTGNICPNGSYCPVGSSDPITCDRGKHCDFEGLESPLGNCTAGYYCGYGSLSAEPRKCKSGHYCPEGTPVERACPVGTFNPDEGKYSLEHCINCTAGYYCPYPGHVDPTFRCLQGYYCPSGSWKNDTSECPKGFYCPTGVGAPKPCPAGE